MFDFDANYDAVPDPPAAPASKKRARSAAQKEALANARTKRQRNLRQDQVLDQAWQQTLKSLSLLSSFAFACA